MKKATARSLNQVLALSSSHLIGGVSSDPDDLGLNRTVGSVMQAIGSQIRRRIKPQFEQAGIDYPPRRVSLVFIKDSARLELWASSDASPSLICRYPFKARGNNCGPKLHRNDGQVPEGIYRVIGLDPNRADYLAMTLNFPNLVDLKFASREGRTNPGSNICIQAGEPSDGCIAVSESVSETLFVLLADVGLSSVTVLISPGDPRIEPLQVPDSPVWVADLYRKITQAFKPYHSLDRTSQLTRLS